jgi:galactokinase
VPPEACAFAPAIPPGVRTFAPGRVNLIGEHTDYNSGLALPFAIAEGVTVSAWATDAQRIRARALDLNECDEFALPCTRRGKRDEFALPCTRRGKRDEFALARTRRGKGWRAFVRGVASELARAGMAVAGADLEIHGNVPQGAGLSSSAALEVSLGLALLGLTGVELERRELARLCSRVENEWVGARTGLLDQLASLFGAAGVALCIDFADLDIQPVPLVLEGGWRLVTLDSGEPRTLAASGYNARRAECAQACELLAVDSLRDAHEDSLDQLPDVLARRVRHVLEENARVLVTVAALREGNLARVGALLDASHASLRDLYECSTPTVDATVQRLKQAGAIGARMVGGGFGGHVLGLFPPGATLPSRAREVHPSRGAHLLSPDSH